MAKENDQGKRKSNAGRKSKHTPELQKQIVERIIQGDSTILQICKDVDISTETFFTWKKKNPEFLDAIEKATDQRNEILYSMAQTKGFKKTEGYDLEEEVIEYDKDGQIISKRVTKKRVEPSDTWLMYVKNNRDGKRWKHRQQLDHEIAGSIDHNVFDYGNLTDAELDERLSKVEKLKESNAKKEE